MSESDDIRGLPFHEAPENLIPSPLADGGTAGPSEPDLEAWTADFHGLLKLGYLSSTFEWCGHKIVIHTLRTDEELIIASIIKEWQETIGGSKAYATAIAALCVDFIDGHPLPIPLGEDQRADRWARERFNYAQRWYPWTIDKIFVEYNVLENRVAEVIREMGKEDPQAAGLNENAGLLSDGDFSGDAPSQ